MSKVVLFIMTTIVFYSCQEFSNESQEQKPDIPKITSRDVWIGMYGEKRDKENFEKINPDPDIVNRIKALEFFRDEDCDYCNFIKISKFYYKGEEYHAYWSWCTKEYDGRQLLYVYMPKYDVFVLRNIRN